MTLIHTTLNPNKYILSDVDYFQEIVFKSEKILRK